MKTRKHGNGLSHKQVVNFSNRLAAQGITNQSPYNTYARGFDEGWKAACKYFAHELRKELREQEQVQDYLQQIK